MNDKVYSEIGSNFRFFLAWRHASFAGMLLILFGTLQLTLSTFGAQRHMAFLVPLLASPVGVLLWVIDVRTRDLYHAAIRAGRKLEGEGSGFYSELGLVTLPPGVSPFSRFSQSAALNVLFWGSSVGMFTLSALLRRWAT